jgi:hypothetical protein
VRPEAAHRGGRGGKRRVLLDIIDRYWDEIDGDFREILGIDALDWFRCRFYPEHYPPGAYPWEQFIRYAVHCTNVQGSALYDETLVETMYQEMVIEQSSKIKKPKPDEVEEERPPRRGYTRLVEAIYDLTDNVVALRAEMGRWPPAQTARAFTKRPWFPAEKAQAMMRRRAKERVNAAVAAAQQRSRQRRQNDIAGSGT